MTGKDNHDVLRSFRVHLGHAHVLVHCESPESAVREARKVLSLEMPRLWDVIHTIDESRFRVACES